MTTLGTTRRRWISSWRWIGAAAAMVTVATAAAPSSARDAAVTPNEHADAPHQNGATANMELVVLFGTTGDKQIPDGFADLGNPPWNAYNHYEILSTKTIPLALSGAATEKLPDGSTLESTLTAVPPPKYSVQLVLRDASGTQVSKATYKVNKNARFFPISTPYKQGGKTGSLVLAVKMT